MPNNKEQLRGLVRAGLSDAIDRLNTALTGEELAALEPVIRRLGRGGVLPHWYEGLKNHGVLPNLDGKTIGSILEMLFVAILETSTLRGSQIPPLRINPARGVDLPDLDLGVKSPSTNYCTSEPFFSAYERLYGNEFDCVIMLTDYQEAKKTPPLRLRVVDSRYLSGSEIADANLCLTALKHRDWLLDKDPAGSWAKRVFRFLAFVNQSDWRAKQLLALVVHLQESDAFIDHLIDRAEADFIKQNTKRLREDKLPIPDTELNALKTIREITPRYVGVIDRLENWLTEVLRDASRAPNDNEWHRLLASPLNGKIGMSFALQWRYNFGKLFGKDVKDVELPLD